VQEAGATTKERKKISTFDQSSRKKRGRERRGRGGRRGSERDKETHKKRQREPQDGAQIKYQITAWKRNTWN
jgi:hypothetical protein